MKKTLDVLLVAKTVEKLLISMKSDILHIELKIYAMGSILRAIFTDKTSRT